MAKYLSLEALSHVWLVTKTYITGVLANKVDRQLKTGSLDTYRVLSDNNLTDALVTKINNAGDSTFSGDYDDLTNKPTIPTNLSQLTNGPGYQTAAQVSSAITTAISDINPGLYKYQGEKATKAAMLSACAGYASPTNDWFLWNVLDEKNCYYFLNGVWNLVDFDVDMSLYLLKTDMVAITNGEIDAIMV